MESSSNRTEWWRQRHSRRRVLTRGGAGVAGLGALGLVGCGDDDDDEEEPTAGGGGQTPGATTQPTQAAQPKQGGVFTIAQTSAFTDTFDPHTSRASAAIFWSYATDIALRLTQDAKELEADLVEDWEIPGDGTEIVLTIREGVKWHNKPPINGRAFTSEDLAYNINRIAGKLNPNEIAQFQRATDLVGLDMAEAVDEKTVSVKLVRPTSTFLTGLTDFRNQFIPADFLDKGGKWDQPATLVGTGPFYIDSFNDSSRAVFLRNPEYFRKGQPYLNEVRWVWVPDVLSHVTAFVNGELDEFSSPTSAQRQTIKQTAKDAQEYVWKYANWNHLRFNTKVDKFAKPEVRRALHLVLEYDANAKAFYGDGYYDLTGPLSHAFPGAYSSEEIMKRAGWNPATKAADTTTAKQLMEAGGYPDGDGLSFKILIASPQQTTQYFDFATRAIAQWKKVFPKIEAEIELPGDAAAFSRRQVQGEFDVISYVIFPQPDGVLDLASQYTAQGSRNYGKYANDRVEGLIDDAFTELDADAREEILKELQDFLIDDQMPIITTNSPRQSSWVGANVRNASGYGGIADGGVYDTRRFTRTFWLET